MFDREYSLTAEGGESAAFSHLSQRTLLYQGSVSASYSHLPTSSNFQSLPIPPDPATAWRLVSRIREELSIALMGRLFQKDMLLMQTC